MQCLILVARRSSASFGVHALCLLDRDRKYNGLVTLNYGHIRKPVKSFSLAFLRGREITCSSVCVALDGVRGVRVECNPVA